MLRRRLRRLLAVYGVSRVVAFGLCAVLALGLADYLTRFQDRGLRVIASSAVLIVLGWAFRRYLLTALSARLGDVQLAGRVQRRFPVLGDSLASSVEFLDQPEDDPVAGSPSLRRAVIAQTTARAEPLDFGNVIESGPTLRAAMTAAAVCLSAAVLVALDATSTRIALARLANPLADVAWPQKTHLEIRKPVERVARGQPFEIEVVDSFGVKLPPEVRVHYRFAGPEGADTEETEQMHLLGGAMVARRENVTRPFSYRVEGGDDRSMPWIEVEVVEPPAVESLAITLVPPAYTGWAVEPAGRHIRALVGSRVLMKGRVTKPLAAADVCLAGKQVIPARLDDGRLRFTVPGRADRQLLVERSGAYWFKLTDREGLTGGGDTRWEIRAVGDRPPSVSIEQPASTVFVTPRAVVPLRLVAKDDLAIRRITLTVEPPDGSEETQAARETPLYEGSKKVEPRSGGLSNIEQGERRLIETRWELSPLELQPGSQLTFHVTACDYLPQTGKSQPRRLVIITPEELAERIAARQTSILNELGRVLKMQREGRSQLADLEVRFSELGQLDRLSVDRLRGAELNQRRIDHGLTSTGEGVPMHILGLLADLKNNKVDSPDVSRRMHALLDEIDRLAREHLPPVSRELTTAIKAAQVQLQEELPKSPKPDVPIAQSLATAGKHEDAVIESLERMLAQLSRWDDYRRFHREIGQLLRDQQDLTRRTSELSQETITRDAKDLHPRESAELSVLARRQAELARRLDRTLQEMARTARNLREGDPLAAETVADAHARATNLALSGQMVGAAGHIGRNRMGQAAGGQQQIISDLQEVLDILANRREHELARLIDKIKQAEADLARLRQSQHDLHGKLERDAAVADQKQRGEKLGTRCDEQSRLGESTERLSRRLDRLMADHPAQATRGAAEKMRQAANSAKADKGADACRQAKEAGDELDEARRRLARRRQRAEAQLAVEQLAQLQDAARLLQERQHEAFLETRRLDGIRRNEGRLAEGQQAELRKLALRQRALAAETTALRSTLKVGRAFVLALSGAAGDMGLAAGLLDRGRTGAGPQQAQQAAERRLAMLLQSLKPEEPGDEPNDPNTGQGQGGAAGKGVKTLAELKLVRLLQEDINVRTLQLEESRRRTGRVTDEARAEYERLDTEQGQLAELLAELLEPEEE